MPGFKAKTIKSIISKKINDWVSTIEDENLRQKVKENTIVTGGCIVSMLLGEPVNDFDIYFRDHDTTLAVATYYTDRFTDRKGKTDFKLFVTDEEGRVKIQAQSVGVASETTPVGEYRYFEGFHDQQGADCVHKVIADSEEIVDTHDDTQIEIAKNPEDQKYRPVFLSSNAITLSNKVQLVLRFYGEPEKIHENYDFVHCTSWWQSWDQTLTLRPEALESCLSKELKYVGSLYPVCSIVRLRKFISRGWRINAGQILKMCMQISALDLTDLKVLEDQLTGVDTAYFLQIIDRLKEKDPEKVNTAYLCEILDRMF
jgi:hypothetical protein